jgi:proteasome alpha subunit
MQPMNHQLMGYDRAITMFSPDGRLLQVEYAKKTVKQGSTAIGMVCKDGVLLCTDKRIVDSLIVPESVEKMYQIDDHIAATASGILSDARVLVERAQLKAQQYRVTYDSPIDTLSIVKDIANLKQLCTQSGGLRPFGVSLLIGGIDGTTPRLFETDPTGIFFQYRAAAIGEGEVEVEEMLHKEYRDDISLDDGMKLAIKALVSTVDDTFNINRLDCVYIKTTTKQFMRVDTDKLRKMFNEVKPDKKKK